ncbi:hypothetical protein B0H14DRAFT_2343857, partial [Mycena olivaceomarginata]
HQTSPFHSQKKWNGRFFEKIDLDKLGLTIFLGHHGRPCPQLTPDDNVRTGFVGERLKFGHTTGLFSCRVRWCECLDQEGSPTPPHVQLVQSCFYPATEERPTTVFTFNLLDEFLIDALECKTAAMTFLAKLRRLTDLVFPLSTPVCCQIILELLYFIGLQL